MNVASLELCKELYELSGWEIVENYLVEDNPFPVTVPAYNLSFLLQKLQSDQTVTLQNRGSSKQWDAVRYTGQSAVADTPENAACKLAIELFKQGVLSHDK